MLDRNLELFMPQRFNRIEPCRAGGGVDADGTIRGIAVNIAARMEQTAPAGALRISHDTYAQVRGIFDVEPQDAIRVKGVDPPIQSYLVPRAKRRSLRRGVVRSPRTGR